MTHYIVICERCGGINSAWDALAPDIESVVDEWKAEGRTVAYITHPPRLSCTCNLPPQMTHDVMSLSREYEEWLNANHAPLQALEKGARLQRELANAVLAAIKKGEK